MIEDLGFLVHEPEEDFRAKSQDYLDGEQFGDFREDAFLFHKRQRGLVPPRSQYDDEVDRPAVVRILRGRDHYQAQYAFGGPVNPRTGEPYSKYSTEYQQWAAEQQKPVLTGEQADLIEHMDFGFRAHGVVRTRYCGVPCHARLDWLNPKRGIVAVMTCDRLSSIESHVRYTGQTHRLAFERSMLAQVIGQNVPVHFIAVGKRLPHRCGVWVVSQAMLGKVRKENEKALRQLAECRRLDRWPTGYEAVRTLAPIGIF